MSEASSTDCVLKGFLLIKSQNGFNIKQNPKKVSIKDLFNNFPFTLADYSQSADKIFSFLKLLVSNYNHHFCKTF